MSGIELLSRYRLGKLLGSGGTSEVYLAFDRTLERDVAVKVLSNELQFEEEWRKRFLQEALLTSKLSHPNVLGIFDYGVLDETRPFIVMEFLRGRSLKDYLDENGNLSVPQALSVFLQIARGMAHAHAAGIIHRDLKPSNIILVEDEGTEVMAKVIDFGLLKPTIASNTEPPLTQQGAVMGSAFYVSPEACVGKQLDNRADVYSLGCLMYECLTGLPPLCGDTILQTMRLHVKSSHRPINEIRSDLDVPAPLVTLVDRCLEKNPDLRPQSMAEVAASIRSIGPIRS